MDGNPYSALLKALRPDQDGRRLEMRLGTVVSAEPLSVRVAGLDLPASAFRMDARLAAGAERSVRFAADTAVVTALESGFAAGDSLLLLTEDDQMFYIMAKVVDAE